MEEPRRDMVLAELERIVQSPAFRGTRRSQEFLRYIVTNAVEGRNECLKERSIGTDVFQRQPDYDTGEDSIVRVKASEVRKRLAQYYREAGERGPVVVELPAGSYVPEFHWQEEPGAARARGAARRRWWMAGIAVVVTAAAVWLAAALSRRSALQEFWAPVSRSPKPVLLCVAHPVVWRLSGASRAAWESGSPPESVPLADIGRDPDHYVGFGDTLALAHLSGFFAREGKRAEMRIGSDTSFSELRGSPAVLIGAFTNQWTVELTSDLRFVFERQGNEMYVRDRMNAAQRWVWQRGSDYAIVSRVFNSKTGEIAVVAGGLSHYGTQVAGEFLTNPAYMEQAAREGPADWKTRNMQLVLYAEVIGRAPGPPKVVARWYW